MNMHHPVSPSCYFNKRKRRTATVKLPCLVVGLVLAGVSGFTHAACLVDPGALVVGSTPE